MGRLSPTGWWPAWLPPRGWRLVGSAPDPDLVPERLPRRGAYIVDRESGPAWLVFDCPCRRRHRLLLNLSPSRQPYWTITSGERLTVRPSVDSFDGGERCHFSLRAGRVHWER
jgi:hypothetical protein